MMAWLGLCLIVLCSSVEIDEQTVSGTCSLFSYCYEELELPDSPLVKLIVTGRLTYSLTPSEYKQPSPTVYLRMDAFPTQYQHLYSSHKQDIHYEEDFPDLAHRLYLRVDGGLNDEFQMQPAYSVKSVTYEFTVRAYYCLEATASQVSLDPQLIECDLPISQIYKPSKMLAVAVPKGTRQLTLDIKADDAVDVAVRYSNRPVNSGQTYHKSATLKIDWPLTGNYFVLLETASASPKVSASLTACEDECLTKTAQRATLNRALSGEADYVFTVTKADLGKFFTITSTLNSKAKITDIASSPPVLRLAASPADLEKASSVFQCAPHSCEVDFSSSLMNVTYHLQYLSEGSLYFSVSHPYLHSATLSTNSCDSLLCRPNTCSADYGTSM
jgi:hypothetical protein